MLIRLQHTPSVRSGNGLVANSPSLTMHINASPLHSPRTRSPSGWLRPSKPMSTEISLQRQWTSTTYKPGHVSISYCVLGRSG